MARKYYLEWKNTENVLYRVDIQSDDYTGSETELNGYGLLSRSSSDIFQPLQITALDLYLEADTTRQLTDIVESEDRYWSIYLYEDGSEKFRGYISTDEIEQSFATDVWEIHIECRGAMGFLEDLSFVDDIGGHYTGYETFINTISKALKRGYNYTSDAMNILISSGLTLSDNSVFEENTYLDMATFIDSNNDAKSCSEVLTELLFSLGLYAIQHNGDILICSVYNYTNLLSSSLSYREYDQDGVFIGTGSFPTSIYQRIGNEVSSADVIHVNSNQSYVSKKYIQSIRSKHTFNYREQIIPNGELIASGSGPYSTQFWTITGEGESFVDGVLIDGKELVTQSVLAMTSTPITLKEGNLLKVTLKHEYVDDPTQLDIRFTLNGVSTYTLRKYGGQNQSFWELGSNNDFRISPTGEGIEEGYFEHIIDIPQLPIDGDLTIEYYTPIFGSNHTVNSKVVVTGVLCESLSDSETGLQYTVNRTDNNKGSVPDVIDIPIATSDTSAILNTFFDSIGDVIETVKFNGGSLIKSLDLVTLNNIYLGEDRRKEFKGDIKGKIEDFTPKRIDSLGGGYILLNYSKDLRTDVSNCTLMQTTKNFVGATFENEEEIVYSKTVEPKIV